MKTIILLLDNRKLLEAIENINFANIDSAILHLKKIGMTEQEEEKLGYYEISEFMDLVNDQVLDNLTETFLGYIRVEK